MLEISLDDDLVAITVDIGFHEERVVFNRIILI